MHPLALLSVLCVLLLCHLRGCSSSSSSSSTGSGPAVSYGSFVLTSASTTAFPPRSRASCAADLSQSSPSATASVFLLGGFNGAGGGQQYNDVYVSSAASYALSVPPQFVQLNQSSSAPFPFSRGGAAAFLLNGALVQFGGQDGVVGNEVYTSQSSPAGVSWSLVTLNAAWSSRSLFASCVLPTTDVLVIAAGQLSTNAPSPPFNSSDVWVSQDGAGASWSQASSSAPFGAVVSAAMTALYDHSLVLCGGLRNSSYLNEVWLSLDVGQTWSLQQPSAGWSARAAHTLAIDGDDLIYLSGGGAGGASIAFDVWVSNTKGATWQSLAVSTASSSLSVPSSVLYGCSVVRVSAGGAKQLMLYSGEDSTGAAVGLAVGNLTTVGLAPASSTGIVLGSSAGATGKPPLGSSSSASPSPTASTSSSSSSGGLSAANRSTASSSSSSTGVQTSDSAQHSVASVAALLLSIAAAAAMM